MNIRAFLSRIPLLFTIYDYYRHIKSSKQIKKIVNYNLQLNLIIGASSTSSKGWISTNKRTLDLLNIKTWETLIPRNYVSHMVAEHVWEHLTEDQGCKALGICLKFLKKNGTLRIAVPDGYHPSKYYKNHVRPSGFGPGAKDHKLIYNHKTISKLLLFFSDYIEFEFLEYYDEKGKLYKKLLDKKYGVVSRTVENRRYLPDSEEFYSSLIVDVKLIKKVK